MLYFFYMWFLLIPFLLILAAPVSHAEVSRLDSIANALDAFDRKLDKAYDSFERVDGTKKQDLGVRKAHTFDLGYEPYFYQYWESIPIKITGMMNSYYANYAYRPSESNPLNNTVVNTYLFDFRYAFGKATYKGSGVSKDEENYNMEIRGMLGKDYLLMDDVLFTPYFGFGYRYLYNVANDIRTSDGHYGYDRRSYYYYLPLGFKINVPHLQGPWSAAFNGEYDIFLRGVQNSDLNAVSPYAGVNYPNLSNRQTGGFGIRGSVRLMYSTPKLDFYLEPFMRYWNIDDSEIKTETSPDGTSFTGLEPHNTTKEIGSKIGLQF